MAKYIKRAGIIFFVLVISCLLILGITMSTKSVNDNVPNLKDSANETIVADTTFVPDITLTGGRTNVTALWNQAIKKSLDEKKEVKVLLDVSWTALYSDKSYSFGTGDGFTENGAILVPNGANIKLDLNGYTIDRHLVKGGEIDNGYVFCVEGTLTIVDNTYDAQVFKDIYNVCKEDKNSINRRISLISVGSVTGGSNTGKGGGIYVANNSILNIYGGMIHGNFAKNGGAIFVDHGAVFHMYNGILFYNETTSYAPGVYVGSSTFYMHDGIIISNTGQGFGGGLHVSGTETALAHFQMTKGIIAHNYSMYGAGVSLCENSENIIYNAEICYNYAFGNSAGLLLWNYSSKADIYNCKINNNIAYFSSGVNGGAGILSNGELNIHSGEICDNTYINSYDDRVVNGGGIYISAGSALFENVVVARNEIKSFINDGEHAFAGGISIASVANVVFGENVQVYDNIAHGINSDIRLNKGQKINVKSSFGRNSHIGIKLADDYGSESFTNGYGTNNSDKNPSEYFFSNDGVKIAILNGGEVSFENTIESNAYDFVYFENDIRKNYADNNLIHAVNDYKKSQTLNGGKLILGNILPNTSVNEFISKLNYSGSHIKLYDSKNKLIYDRGNSVANINASLYDNNLELAVGTGWKLETYTNSNVKIEEFSLSVLGDLNGDGRISASDCALLRQVANNQTIFESINIELKLACIIINKGSVTTADAEVIRNVIEKKINLDIYF